MKKVIDHRMFGQGKLQLDFLAGLLGQYQLHCFEEGGFLFIGQAFPPAIFR